MRTVVCPGSFDPVTHGHLDIIGRAARLFDRVVVAVLVNEKKQGMFTIPERIELLREAIAASPDVDHERVEVDSFKGLLVDFCLAHDIHAIVKGLRAVTDFDYELQMAQMNAGLAEVDTVFVPTSPEWSYLASSLVKEVARHGGDVSHLVPAHVHRALLERVAGTG